MRFFPYLDLWFDCGLLTIETELWHERYVSNTKEWIVVSVQFFRRWGFRFRLYSPHR